MPQSDDWCQRVARAFHTSVRNRTGDTPDTRGSTHDTHDTAHRVPSTTELMRHDACCGRGVDLETKPQREPANHPAVLWRERHVGQEIGRAREGGCPQRGAPWRPCIYMGLPLRMCMDDGCNTRVGAGAWLSRVLPITTDEGEIAFMVYEGGYLKALWHWLYNGPE